MTNDPSSPTDPSENSHLAFPLARGEGVTGAERYLKRLCERSFLRLWSYAGLYNDKDLPPNGGHGKEICDLLVVFDKHIIIFSSKDIHFGDVKNENSWPRWHRKAVLAGAKQVWGAERWIRNFPTRIFLDRACKQVFPYELPSSDEAVIHRIVVAHGASIPCKSVMGGSGSLMLFPFLGDSSEMPFAVGDLDVSKGYVHVLDDTSLQVVMSESDTVTDFVNYLAKKEAFIRAGRLLSAAGEEELLAFYLKELGPDGSHDIVMPSGDFTGLVLDEGHYAAYLKNPQRHRKVAANRVSYVWDRLIESFSGNAMNGTLYNPPNSRIDYIEPGLRLLARESRVSRRMLATSLGGFLEAAGKSASARRVRVSQSTKPDDPHYVFLTLRSPKGITNEQYRLGRQSLLLDSCRVVRLMIPDARKIVGLAFDPPGTGQSSEDLMVYDGTQFDDEEREAAQRAQQELGLLTKLERYEYSIKEYPDDGKSSSLVSSLPGKKPFPDTGRNDRCPCGSGKKYKKCCGR